MGNYVRYVCLEVCVYMMSEERIVMLWEDNGRRRRNGFWIFFSGCLILGRLFL